MKNIQNISLFSFFRKINLVNLKLVMYHVYRRISIFQSVTHHMLHVKEFQLQLITSKKKRINSKYIFD